MRLSKNVQVLLFSSIAAVTTALAMAGNRLQKDPEKLLEKTIEDALKKWKERLFLTEEQSELMRKTLKDFGMRKNKILQLKINREGKKERLQEIQLLENEEMRKILADSQYETYLDLISERVKK